MFQKSEPKQTENEKLETAMTLVEVLGNLHSLCLKGGMHGKW